MNVAIPLIFVGLLDVALGVFFWHLSSRINFVVAMWPDPGPQHWDSGNRASLIQKAGLLNIAKVVCLNSGASFVATGLIVFGGAL